MSRTPFEDTLCQPCNFWGNRVSPRITEAEFSSSFFSGDFCGCFDGGPEGIPMSTGVFPVGVINAPQFVFSVRSQVHASSKHQTASSIVPMRHILLLVVQSCLLRCCCDGEFSQFEIANHQSTEWPFLKRARAESILKQSADSETANECEFVWLNSTVFSLSSFRVPAGKLDSLNAVQPLW